MLCKGMNTESQNFPELKNTRKDLLKIVFEL